MRFFVLFLLGSLSFQYSFAQEFETALKSDNPDELAYYASMDTECPVSRNALENMVEGVIVRSRVKPTNYSDATDVYLNVVLSCLAAEAGNRQIGYTYFLDVRFGRPGTILLYDRQFGVLGLIPNDKILDELKNHVEAAVTAYIKANL